MAKAPTYFHGIIGQNSVKKQLSFYIESFQKTSILPHIFLLGQKGGGKTKLAEEVARNLIPVGDLVAKPLLTLNATTIKNVAQFVEIWDTHVKEDKITLFIDEVHELPIKVQAILLTILNPNKSNKNCFNYMGQDRWADFTKISFIFATTDPQKVFPPLKDRCKMIHLQEYSYPELSQIIVLNLHSDEVVIDPTILPHIAAVCRGNARNAVLMATDHINPYVIQNDVTLFNRYHWKKLVGILGILPLGLENTEWQILRALNNAGDSVSLTGLAAMTGLSKEAIQREFESYLLKHNLVAIQPKGRYITPKGHKYIEKAIKMGHPV